MSQAPAFAPSTMAPTLSYATIVRGTANLRPSSRARSIATPLDSPVAGSFLARITLP